MAVVWAREHWEGRDGSFENILSHSVARTWKVKTDNKFDDQFTIIDHFAAALGIRYLSQHPRNGFMTVRKLDAKQETASPYFWRVTVNYSSEPLDEEEPPQNPLAMPPEIEGDSEMSQVFTTEDKDGRPMLNAAGDPFEPVEKDDPRGVIRITRNFPSIPSFVSTYINKVNSDGFSIPGIPASFAPRTAKFQRFRFGKRQIQNDIPFVPVTVELAIKSSTWDQRRLEEGFYYLASGVRKRIQINGADSVELVPLTAAGAILTNPTPTNAVYVIKKIYEEVPFGVLFS